MSILIMIVLFIKNITYNNHLVIPFYLGFALDQQESEKHLFIHSYSYKY